MALAKRLEQKYGHKLVRNTATLVMAIPRGGVITGDVIAEYLGVRMDVVVSRKVGSPSNPELAIGAVTPDGVFFANADIIQATGVTNSYISEQIAKQKKEIERRLLKFRGTTDYDLDAQTIVLVDDGIATGATMFAAIDWLRKYGPKKLIVAAPVGAYETIQRLKQAADDVVILHAPAFFHGVGEFYEDFTQVEDDEVVAIMSKYPRSR